MVKKSELQIFSSSICYFRIALYSRRVSLVLAAQALLDFAQLIIGFIKSQFAEVRPPQRSVASWQVSIDAKLTFSQALGCRENQN